MTMLNILFILLVVSVAVARWQSCFMLLYEFLSGKIPRTNGCIFQHVTERVIAFNGT